MTAEKKTKQQAPNYALRCPPDLLQKARERARREGTFVSQILTQALQDYVAQGVVKEDPVKAEAHWIMEYIRCLGPEYPPGAVLRELVAMGRTELLPPEARLTPKKRRD